MKLRNALPLVAVVLMLASASAQGASRHGRLDQSFGEGGVAKVPAPRSGNGITGFTVAADGRVYILDGPELIGLEPDGEPALGLDGSGRITPSPAAGAGPPLDFAIDSAGRILVAGSTRPAGRTTDEAYVLRALPDGTLDASFGDGGEVVTEFDLPGKSGREAPNVYIDSIDLDAQDRPIVGGSFGEGKKVCNFEGAGHHPFVGRLTAGGAIDRTFADSGHAVLGGPGAVESLAETSDGEVIFVRPCSTPPRFESLPPFFSVLDEDGEAGPLNTRVGLPFTYGSPTVEPGGRIVELESPPPAGEGLSALARFLPDGRRDPTFGRHGRILLRHRLGKASTFAVDSAGRTIIAVPGRIDLRRLLPSGKIDMTFGPGGRLTTRGEDPSAIAFDSRGRIYTAGLVRGGSEKTIEVARFLPGR